MMYSRKRENRKIGKKRNIGKKTMKNRSGGERRNPSYSRPSVTRRPSVRSRSIRHALNPPRPYQSWSEEDIEDEVEATEGRILEQLVQIRENESRGIDNLANVNTLNHLISKKNKLNTEKQIRGILQRR